MAMPILYIVWPNTTMLLEWKLYFEILTFFHFILPLSYKLKTFPILHTLVRFPGPLGYSKNIFEQVYNFARCRITWF